MNRLQYQSPCGPVAFASKTSVQAMAVVAPNQMEVFAAAGCNGHELPLHRTAPGADGLSG